MAARRRITSLKALCASAQGFYCTKLNHGSRHYRQRAMVRFHDRVSRLDVRRLGDGHFPDCGAPALQESLDAQADQQVGPWMGYITALFLVGAGGRFALRLAGRQGGEGPGDGGQHPDVFAFHRCVLLRYGAVASGFLPLRGGLGHGRRMGAGCGAGPGMLAGGQTPAPGGRDWGGRRLTLFCAWPRWFPAACCSEP